MPLQGLGAEPTWHCSRATDQQARKGEARHDLDTFYVASAGSNKDAISLSLGDLTDIYTGKRVRVGQGVVTACFMLGDTPQLMKALGVNVRVVQQLARKSAIVQSPLQPVADEGEMRACIGQNYPAVGYLRTTTENDRIVPCY